LESIAEPHAQRVINECAQSGYSIVSPCKKLCLDLPISADNIDETAEQKHPCVQLFKQMNDTFKQATNYSWMPLYGKTIVHQDNHLELHTYLKAIVIFNYKHRLNMCEAGKQEDLAGLYQLGDDIAKLFTPEATVIRPTSIEELYAWIEEHKLNLQHWLFSTDLSFFVKGGRISKASGFVGNLLNICPLIDVSADGKLTPRRKIRTKKKVMEAIVAQMETLAYKGLEYSEKCFMCHSGCLEDAKKVASMIEERFHELKGKVQIFNIGPAIGCHAGPGTVGVFFWGAKRV
jgi:hypothetical protein